MSNSDQASSVERIRSALDVFFKAFPITHLKSVAVAVSGGADSLALAHACHAAFPDIHLHILTVDHGLRAQSAAEAAHVKALVEDWGGDHITHVTLGGAMPFEGTKLQEGARNYRYDLMREYCERENIPLLLTAHHGDDQLETFLMRLCAGSTPSGLKAMQDTVQMSDNLVLGRPLLALKHADCVAYCHEKAIKWIEDPSNENEGFQRVRFRQMAGFFEGEGFDVERLSALTRRLSELDALLEDAVMSAKERICKEKTSKRIVFAFSNFNSLNRRVAVGLMDEALTALGLSKTYGPRLHKVEQLVDDLREGAMGKARTLNGCKITPDVARDELVITPE